MPTRITFIVAGSSQPLTLDVEEEPESVTRAFERARDAVALKGPNGQTYYVNPATVVYWTEQPPGPTAAA